MSLHCSTSLHTSLKRYCKVTLIIEHYSDFLLLANDYQYFDNFSIKHHFIFILRFDSTIDKTLVNIFSVSITDN